VIQLLPVTDAGDSDIPLRSAAGFFCECMQYLNRFREFGDIDQSMFAVGMDANLPDSRAYGGHRFPIPLTRYACYRIAQNGEGRRQVWIMSRQAINSKTLKYN